VLFWIAFGISVVAATLGTRLISQSLKYSIPAMIGAVVVVGGGLLWLDGWLHKQRVEQDAANQPPKSIYEAPRAPSVPIAKTPKLRPQPPHVKIDQHGTGNGAVGGNLTVAPCSNSSVGGINVQQSVTSGSPQRTLTTEQETQVKALTESLPKNIQIWVHTIANPEPVTFAQQILKTIASVREEVS
jgi:hypothetical protein